MWLAQLLDSQLRPLPKTMHAGFAIHLSGRPAHQGRKLPRASPPQQVHLKEAVLRVEKAERPRHIEPALAPHRRHAEAIPLNNDLRHKPSQRSAALKLRQARPHPPEGEQCQHHTAAKHNAGRNAQAAKPAAATRETPRIARGGMAWNRRRWADWH